MTYDYDRERNEAIAAGEKAMASLKAALTALDSARGWGIYDIIGGGFIASLIKHSKMDQASRYIEEAKENLMSFGRELGDIREYADVNLSTGDFWGFADWFCDGLLADWVMQSRINDARDQVKGAILKVERILTDLRAS